MQSAHSPFEIEATIRQKSGKRASRRLRRQEQLPAVVYGGNKETLSLTLSHHKITKTLSNEAVYSKILTLKINDVSELVILKAINRHPYKPRLQHIDFQRVREDEKLQMPIPIRFRGDDVAPGVKEGGGIVSHLMNEIEVTCLPAHLPPFIEIDISAMQLNQTKHLSDLTLPEGVESVALLHHDDKAIVSIHLPRVEEEPTPEEAVATSAEVPATAQKSATEASNNAAPVKEDEKKKK